MADKDIMADVRAAWKAARDTVFKAAIAEGETLPDLEMVRMAFHDEYGEVYDLINGEGFKAGEGRIINKSKKVTEQLQAAERDRDRLAEELEEARAKTPDVAKIKESYQAQLKKAESKADETIGELKGRLVKVQRERVLTDFEKALVSEGMKDRAAKSYATIYADRFRFTDDDQLEVLQPGTDTPFMVSKGNAYDPLVKKIKAEADPDDIKASVDTRGAGPTRQGYGGTAARPATAPGKAAEVAAEDAAAKFKRDTLFTL